jgi:AraC family L-rhamnose operon transcriptional activator RhaR/AraC family L-rhamnose operon regulatory protein RhaS
LVDSPLYAAIFKVSPFLRREASESARFTPEPSSFGRMVRAVEEMEAELGESSQESLWMAQSLLLRLVVLVLRSTSEGASREGVDYRSSRAYRLGSLVSSLEARPDVSVDVGEMARRSHVSESTLFRSFHRAFGTTPIRYRDKIRMERAAELLLSTARPVVDIALELGFSDGNYFSRRFKTIRGISPGAYRRHAREVLAGR